MKSAMGLKKLWGLLTGRNDRFQIYFFKIFLVVKLQCLIENLDFSHPTFWLKHQGKWKIRYIVRYMELKTKSFDYICKIYYEDIEHTFSFLNPSFDVNLLYFLLLPSIFLP